MSTQNPMQQLYAMQMMSSMQPYMKQTASGLSEMGNTATNNFQAIPNWNQYINQRYTDPAMYSLNNQLKDLGHTNEYFSSGYQNRVASAKGGVDSQLRQASAEDMMGQRQGYMGGMESALQRQLKALNQFGQVMSGPLSVQGQENSITPKSLLSSIFGG